MTHFSIRKTATKQSYKNNCIAEQTNYMNKTLGIINTKKFYKINGKLIASYERKRNK